MSPARCTLGFLPFAFLAACADTPPSEPPDSTGSTGSGGSPPSFPCPPGEAQTEAGCDPAGILPDRCGDGFTSDGAQGCVVVLPPARCPEAQIAVPGDSACREIAPCGAAPWGDAPVDDATQFVDAGYQGGQSDGSEARPWTTIQDAVDRALPGALVAIAAGTYTEGVTVFGPPVRLWGRCPALVEVVTPNASTMGVLIREGADGTLVHGLALRGPGPGIGVTAAKDVVVEQVWIHDTGDIGLAPIDFIGPVQLTVRGSLIERAAGAGIALTGAALTVEGTVVRDILVAARGPEADHGIGIDILSSRQNRAGLTARSTMIEQSRGLGVRIAGADATIERSVVRDTEWLGPDQEGVGLVITDSRDGGVARATVRESVFERNSSAAIAAIGSELTLEAVTARDTRPEPAEGESGIAVGLYIEPSQLDSHPGHAWLRGVVIEQSRGVGLALYGSTADIQGLLVRDTVPGPQDSGKAIEVGHRQQRASATIRGSVLERAYGGGAAIFGAEVTFDATLVREITPLPSTQELGRGIHIQSMPFPDGRSNVTLRNVLIEKSTDAGLAVFDADALVDSSTIARTLVRPLDGAYGYGVVAYYDGGHTNVHIQGSRVVESATAGVFNLAGNVKLEKTRFDCQPLDLAQGDVGGVPGVYEDLGGNSCGCQGQSVACEAKSVVIEPPKPLTPSPGP